MLAEQDGGELPWYHDGFAFAQDTPLGATTAAQLRCERKRGLVPNVVAVDFYENSGVVEVARRMNAAR